MFSLPPRLQPDRKAVEARARELSRKRDIRRRGRKPPSTLTLDVSFVDANQYTPGAGPGHPSSRTLTLSSATSVAELYVAVAKAYKVKRTSHIMLITGGELLGHEDTDTVVVAGISRRGSVKALPNYSGQGGIYETITPSPLMRSSDALLHRGLVSAMVALKSRSEEKIAACDSSLLRTYPVGTTITGLREPPSDGWKHHDPAYGTIPSRGRGPRLELSNVFHERPHEPAYLYSAKNGTLGSAGETKNLASMLLEKKCIPVTGGLKLLSASGDGLIPLNRAVGRKIVSVTYTECASPQGAACGGPVCGTAPTTLASRARLRTCCSLLLEDGTRLYAAAESGEPATLACVYHAGMEGTLFPPDYPADDWPASTQACEECGATLEGTTLSRCGGCRAVAFCSKACQKASWPRHKKACHALSDDLSKPTRFPDTSGGGLDAVNNACTRPGPLSTPPILRHAWD